MNSEVEHRSHKKGKGKSRNSNQSSNDAENRSMPPQVAQNFENLFQRLHLQFETHPNLFLQQYVLTPEDLLFFLRLLFLH